MQLSAVGAQAAAFYVSEFGTPGSMGKDDQTAQEVRFRGKFDANLILFVGDSVRYVF